MARGRSQPFRTGPSPWGRARADAGISLRELERRTGINRGRLSNIERGLSPSPDESRRILAALATDEVSRATS